MSKVLIIGCGGVASVAIHKCCQVPEVFTEICIASRTKSKCDKLAAELAPKTATKITTAQVDADGATCGAVRVRVADRATVEGELDTREGQLDAAWALANLVWEGRVSIDDPVFARFDQLP